MKLPTVSLFLLFVDLSIQRPATFFNSQAALSLPVDNRQLSISSGDLKSSRSTSSVSILEFTESSAKSYGGQCLTTTGPSNLLQITKQNFQHTDFVTCGVTVFSKSGCSGLSRYVRVSTTEFYSNVWRKELDVPFNSYNMECGKVYTASE